MNLANLFKSHFFPWDSRFRLTKDKQKTKTIHTFSFRNSRGWSLTWAVKRWKHYCTSNALSCSSFSSFSLLPLSSLLPPLFSLLSPLSSLLPSPSPPFLPPLHRWNLPFVCNSTTLNQWHLTLLGPVARLRETHKHTGEWRRDETLGKYIHVQYTEQRDLHSERYNSKSWSSCLIYVQVQSISVMQILLSLLEF